MSVRVERRSVYICLSTKLSDITAIIFKTDCISEYPETESNCHLQDPRFLARQVGPMPTVAKVSAHYPLMLSGCCRAYTYSNPTETALLPVSGKGGGITPRDSWLYPMVLVR